MSGILILREVMNTLASISDLWMDMKRVLRSARLVINSELEPLNLSGAEGDILFHLINGCNNQQQEKLAESLDIGKAAVSRAVDSLEAKGFVMRTRHLVDKRAYCLSLTEKAYLVGADITGIYERLYSHVRSVISDEDLVNIKAILARVDLVLRSQGDH